MKRRDLGLAIIALLFVAVSSGFASGRSGGGFQNVTPNTLAKSRGCRDGGVGGINKTNPSWVSVEAADQAKIAEGIIRKSAVTHTDFPTNHESHDWNYHVFLDPQYQVMNSDANELEGSERWMEMEWETKQLDMRFWPMVDDRTWTLGRWIFDCGHPPYRTEIHPPKVVAFSRVDPHVFRGDTAPSHTNKIYLFANPNGGYFYDGIRGTYEFDLPLPPRPSASATPFAEVVETTFGGVAPTFTLPAATSPTTGVIAPIRLQLLRPQMLQFTAAGRSTPRSVPRSTFPGREVVRVKWDLSGVGDNGRWNLYKDSLSSRPGGRSPMFGAVLAAGWREKPAISKGYRVLRVTFDNIKVNSDHDPLASGEWRMWGAANGNWFQIAGLGDVDDGDTVQINKIVNVMVPDDGQLAVTATGWESDPMDDNFRMASPGLGSTIDFGNLDENDDIGSFYFKYGPAQNFGIGSHDDKSTAGDYQIRYRIEEVQRIAPGTPNGAGNPAATGRKQVTVIFASAKILDDSDGTFRGSGEIYFNFDVNGSKMRHPSRGHQSIDGGSTMTIRRGTSATLGPLDNLRILVEGWEDDSPDQDDDMGRLILNFTRAQNYGAGTHTIRGPKKDGQYEMTFTITVRDLP